MSKKYTLDFDLFRSLPSCVGMLHDGYGSYCAQGKVFKSISMKEVPQTYEYVGSQVYNLGQELGFFKDINVTGMLTIAVINNDRHFERADRMALNTAIDSGLVEIKSSSDELVKEFLSIKEDKVCTSV